MRNNCTYDSARVAAVLANLTTLNLLVLDACPQISDAGLVHLAGLKDLETLRIVDTKVTPAGEAKFNKAIPHCQNKR